MKRQIIYHSDTAISRYEWSDLASDRFPMTFHESWARAWIDFMMTGSTLCV